MTVQLPGKPSLEVVSGDATSVYMPEEPQYCTCKWYFSRQEIEEDSPSRRDGIELKKESQLQKLYCLFLQEIGKSLKVPQVTIAAAMLLCHRFYMRQSHAKNDWQTIATVCMFLACKLEETPRPLKDVVVISFEITHKQDPSAQKRIRQREVFCKQKELLLIGERLLLATIAFDLNIQLPYMPLVTALKRLNIFSDLAQVAWSFVNDWLCTTLCLQYKPHYIAAGSMFLAAKFQKLKLPTEKGKVWWLEFDVSPKQLQEVIQHMLRLWEQDRNQALPTTLGKITQSAERAGKAVVRAGKSVVTLGKVTQSAEGAGKAVVTSPQSCVSSASVVDRHSSHKGTVDVGGFGKSVISDQQNPTCSDSQALVKEVLQTQTSNNGCSSRKSILSDCGQNPTCGESQAPVKEVLQTQTSNNGYSSSVFENDDREKIQPIKREQIQPITRENILPITRECNQNPSYNIVSAHKKCSKIDADRIREMLKRRRSDKAANKNLERVGAIDAEIDYDAWIERELENGIELESASSKKLKVVL